MSQSSLRPADHRSLHEELAQLWWLQRRLLSGAIRRGDRRSRARILTVLVLLAAFLPNAAILSLGLLFLMRSADADQFLRVVSAGFTFLLLVWAAAPVTAQALLEGINLPRLLPYPIRFRSLALGSLSGSAFGLLGLLSLPLLAAATAGAARGLASGLAAILSSTLFLCLLIIVKALSTTLYDLLAEDRRLRGALTFAVFLLPLGMYLDQVGISGPGQHAGGIPFFSPDAVSTRLAAWLPGGWLAQALRSAVDGQWAGWALGSLALLAATLGGFGLQLVLLRRLHLGELLRFGPRRQRRARSALRDLRRLPLLDIESSRALRGLVWKDWLCFRRSPLSLRLGILPLIFGFMAYFLTKSGEIPVPVGLLGLGMGGFAAFLISSIGSNSFGLVDHVGVASLFLSPAPRRLILLSQGLLLGGLTLLMAFVTGLGGALGSGDWRVLPAALLGALGAFSVLGGTAHLCSVLFPIYIDVERGQNQVNQQAFAASLLMMIGGPLLLIPLIAPILASAFLAPDLMPLALAFSLLYAPACYLLQSSLALRLLRSREQHLVQTIAEDR